MFQRNSRLQKFRTIIKEINATTTAETKEVKVNCNEPQFKSSSPEEKNKPEITDNFQDTSSLAPYSLRKSVSLEQLSPTATQAYPSIAEITTNEQEIQIFRNRKSSCSSCSDHNSEKDFSPASDDDHEFVPSSGDDTSSCESKTTDKNKKLQAKVGNLSFKRRSSSSSSSSSSSTSTSSSTSSSGSESDSDSSVNDAASPPAKQKCNNVPNTQTQNESAKPSVASFQQQSLVYPYSSSSAEDDEMDTSILNCSKTSNPGHDNIAILLQENTPPRHLSGGSQSNVSFNSLFDNEQSFLCNSDLNNFQADTTYVVLPPSASDILVDSSEKFQRPVPSLSLNNPLPLKVLAMDKVNDIIPTQGSSNLVGESATTSASQNNSDLLNTKRKRKRGSKKDEAKKLRNKGLGYTSSSKQKKVISERKMGSPCSDRCKLKCNEKITNQDRTKIFKNYWNMGTLTKQRDFIAKHITEIKPKYQYKRIDSNRKNKHAFYLTVNEEKCRVCKIYFKSTLGINDRPIRTVIEKLNSSGIVEPDLRGKHENHGTKVSPDLLDGVRKHIDSISRIESHYLRKQTTREYIEGGKTVTDLHTDYVNNCIAKGLDYVKIHIYRKVFNENYNIGFFTPKKDQCEDCVAYSNADPALRGKLEENYRNHLKEKELSREEKSKDKTLIDENHIVACYDLQAMLPVPKGDVSTFYYKSRLNCLNFTICELKTDNTECFFWSEVEGQKGANEIGSCVYKFIEKKSNMSSNRLNITFYSDNCCGQQKNQFVFFMYIYAVKNFANIQSITHKFLIKGHTQNENDSVHSTIERQIKKLLKSGPIYVPGQYIYAIREAKKKGKKYNVTEMSHAEFYDIKSLQEFKLTRNINGEIIKTSDIKILKIEKTESETNSVKVSYKTSYSQDFKEVKLQKNARARPQLKRLYTSKLPLTGRKKEDLRSLLRKNVIPSYYASSFYNSIL